MLVGWAVCSSSPESNGRGEDPEGVQADGVHFPSTEKHVRYLNSAYNHMYAALTKIALQLADLVCLGPAQWCGRHCVRDQRRWWGTFLESWKGCSSHTQRKGSTWPPSSLRTSPQDPVYIIYIYKYIKFFKKRIAYRTAHLTPNICFVSLIAVVFTCINIYPINNFEHF